MADGYIDTDDIVLYGFQTDLDNNEELFKALIPRASQFFDILCGVEPGHFLVKGTEATDKVIYGSGGVLLAIPPHIGNVVSVATSNLNYYPQAKFIEEAGYLRITDSLGLPQGVGAPYLYWQGSVPFTVRAKWGYAAVPETVKQATVEILITLWRSRDQAWTKAVNLDSNQLTFNPAIPKRAKVIAASFRNARPSTSAFV
jgi:hypothetical protein